MLHISDRTPYQTAVTSVPSSSSYSVTVSSTHAIFQIFGYPVGSQSPTPSESVKSRAPVNMGFGPSPYAP